MASAFQIIFSVNTAVVRYLLSCLLSCDVSHLSYLANMLARLYTGAALVVLHLTVLLLHGYTL